MLYRGDYMRHRFDLEALKAPLAQVGNPHLKMPPTIHIAGTNGKGSTLAFLKGILESHGLRVHRYTSPHLVDVTERIELSGTPIDANLLQHYMSLFSEELTPFEHLTLAAFKAFSDHPADVLLLETGMGGRLDATNIIPTPLATAFARIDFDHQEFLGPTLIDIATEKAGIIKHKTPIFSTLQQDDVSTLLRQRAQINQCDYYEVTQEDLDALPPLSLQGQHQKMNASLALKMIQTLWPEISAATHQKGLLDTKWPGRLQHLGQNIWVDGAHNPHGAHALAHEIKAWEQPITLIWGMGRRKAPVEFIQHLLPLTEAQFTLSLQPEHDFFTAQELCHFAPKATPAHSLEQAVQLAKKFFPQSSILITGSLYLVQEALRIGQSHADS